MGAAEVLNTVYIDANKYECLAKSIFKKILDDKPFLGSKLINVPNDLVNIQVDVSNYEEDFESYQVDQITLNHISITDQHGFSMDCEESIGDLVDEMLSEYNNSIVETAEQELSFSY